MKAAVFAIVFISFVFNTACVHQTKPEIKQSDSIQKIPSMGGFFEIQLTEKVPQATREALFLRIKKQLDEIESEMSLYQSQSALSQLNRSGSVKNVSQHFLRNLELAKIHHGKTKGHFNIAILPVLDEIRKSFKDTSLPPKNLRSLKSLLDIKNIIVTNDSVSLKVKGMKLTLDGIAKGYAVDLVADGLEQQGISDFLVNFSGNMRWSGRRSDGSFWKIAVWDYKNQKALALPMIEKGAIASSGAEHNYVSEDFRWHHIIDPVSLRSPEHIVGSSVIGPSATVCDILSTSLFIFSDTARKEIMESQYPEYKYWVMHRDGQSDTTMWPDTRE